MKKFALLVSFLIVLAACGPRYIYPHLDWLRNREKIQTEARRILVHRRSNPEFRATLGKIIVNPEQMRAPAYQTKIEANTDLTLKLIIQLERLLTPSQRSYLLKRIDSLATDFDKLSCDPGDLSRADKPTLNIEQ